MHEVRLIFHQSAYRSARRRPSRPRATAQTRRARRPAEDGRRPVVPVADEAGGGAWNGADAGDLRPRCATLSVGVYESTRLWSSIASRVSRYTRYRAYTVERAWRATPPTRRAVASGCPPPESICERRRRSVHAAACARDDVENPPASATRRSMRGAEVTKKAGCSRAGAAPRRTTSGWSSMRKAKFCRRRSLPSARRHLRLPRRAFQPLPGTPYYATDEERLPSAAARPRRRRCGARARAARTGAASSSGSPPRRQAGGGGVANARPLRARTRRSRSASRCFVTRLEQRSSAVFRISGAATAQPRRRRDRRADGQRRRARLAPPAVATRRCRAPPRRPLRAEEQRWLQRRRSGRWGARPPPLSRRRTEEQERAREG